MIRSTLEFWYSGHTTYRNNRILPKYRNTREKYRNTYWLWLRNEYTRRTILKSPEANSPTPPISFIPLFSAASDLGLRCCIGLSIPIFRFFKFLIRASFVCISDEKRLYKISLFFSRLGFRHDFMWRTTTSTWFLNARQGKCCFVTFHFLGILIIIMFSIYT